MAAKIAFTRITAHLADCAIQERIVCCCFTGADLQVYRSLLELP